MANSGGSNAWPTEASSIWLQEKFKLSKKATGDVYSRCRRVERVLGISIYDETSSESRFVELMNGIKAHFVGISEIDSPPYAAVTTHCAAVRKLAQYFHGNVVTKYKVLRKNVSYKRGV